MRLRCLVAICAVLAASVVQAATPYATVQLRRDTPSNWASANPILKNGEPGCELTGSPLRCTAQKIGDGVTHWSSLPYVWGVTSLGGLTAPAQTFVNDTNVTVTSGAGAHALGWAGTLSKARGGTGADMSNVTFPSSGTILATTAPVTGVAKLTAGAIGTATAGVDYQAPIIRPVTGPVAPLSGYVTKWNGAGLDIGSAFKYGTMTNAKLCNFDSTNGLECTVDPSTYTNASNVSTGTLAKARGGTGADMSAVTFPSSGTLATLASLGYVFPEQYGAGGGDDAVRINAAIAAAKKVWLTGPYHITTPLVVPSGTTLEGPALLDGGALIYTNVSGDYSIKSLGDTKGAGDHVLNDITLKNFKLIKEGGNSTKGIKWAAVSNSHMDGVKVHGMNGGPSYHFVQVWDAWVDNGYDHSNASSGSSTVIEYGDSDNSNNIRFRGFTWENFAHAALEIKAGTGANNIYKINLDGGCKMESGVSTDPFLLVSSGVLGSSRVAGGILTNINAANTNKLVATTGTGVLYDVDFTSTELTSYNSAASAGLVSMLNSQNVRFDNVKFYNTGGWSGPPVVVDAGSNRYSSVNCSINALNTLDVFSGTNSQAGLNTSTRMRVNRQVSGTTYFLEVEPLSTGVNINTVDGTVLNLVGGNVGVGMTPTTKFEVSGVGQAQRWGAKTTSTSYYGNRSTSPTDQKIWDIWQDDTGWYLRMVDDAYINSTPAIKVSRSGYTPTAVAFPFMTSNGFLKTTGSNGSLTVDTTAYAPTMGATLTGQKETVVAGGTCSTSYNVNPTNGTMVTLNLSGACQVGVTSLAAGHSFTLFLTQSSTTAPTFTSAFKWAGGTAPTWSTSATKYDTVRCSSPDGTKAICSAIVDGR